jgi:hypothetical protein
MGRGMGLVRAVVSMLCQRESSMKPYPPLLFLAEDLCAQLPSQVTSPAPQGLVDRIVPRFLGS